MRSAGTLLGVLTQKYGVRALTVGAMVLSTVAVAAFGQTTPGSVQRLSMICAVAGFCLMEPLSEIYALFAKAFPTHVRATGTGFAIGCGRGGAVIAPVIAGYLFNGDIAFRRSHWLWGSAQPWRPEYCCFCTLTRQVLPNNRYGPRRRGQISRVPRRFSAACGRTLAREGRGEILKSDDSCISNPEIPKS